MAVISPVDTENGEHGASAIRSIDVGDASWCASTSRWESARISSSVCTTESGGSPPSLTDRDIDPRVGWKRIPSSWAAPISALMRSPAPRGCTYRWSVDVVVPPSASSVSPTYALTYAASSSSRAQSGYSVTSHSNSPPVSAGAKARVRFWYR